MNDQTFSQNVLKALCYMKDELSEDDMNCIKYWKQQFEQHLQKTITTNELQENNRNSASAKIQEQDTEKQLSLGKLLEGLREVGSLYIPLKALLSTSISRTIEQLCNDPIPQVSSYSQYVLEKWYEQVFQARLILSSQNLNQKHKEQLEKERRESEKQQLDASKKVDQQQVPQEYQASQQEQQASQQEQQTSQQEQQKSQKEQQQSQQEQQMSQQQSKNAHHEQLQRLHSQQYKQKQYQKQQQQHLLQQDWSTQQYQRQEVQEERKDSNTRSFDQNQNIGGQINSQKANSSTQSQILHINQQASIQITQRQQQQQPQQQHQQKYQLQHQQQRYQHLTQQQTNRQAGTISTNHGATLELEPERCQQIGNLESNVALGNYQAQSTQRQEQGCQQAQDDIQLQNNQYLQGMQQVQNKQGLGNNEGYSFQDKENQTFGKECDPGYRSPSTKVVSDVTRTKSYSDTCQNQQNLVCTELIQNTHPLYCYNGAREIIPEKIFTTHSTKFNKPFDGQETAQMQRFWEQNKSFLVPQKSSQQKQSDNNYNISQQTQIKMNQITHNKKDPVSHYNLNNINDVYCNVSSNTYNFDKFSKGNSQDNSHGFKNLFEYCPSVVSKDKGTGQDQSPFMGSQEDQQTFLNTTHLVSKSAWHQCTQQGHQQQSQVPQLGTKVQSDFQNTANIHNKDDSIKQVVLGAQLYQSKEDEAQQKYYQEQPITQYTYQEKQLQELQDKNIMPQQYSPYLLQQPSVQQNHKQCYLQLQQQVQIQTRHPSLQKQPYQQFQSWHSQQYQPQQQQQLCQQQQQEQCSKQIHGRLQGSRRAQYDKGQTLQVANEIVNPDKDLKIAKSRKPRSFSKNEVLSQQIVSQAKPIACNEYRCISTDQNMNSTKQAANTYCMEREEQQPRIEQPSQHVYTIEEINVQGDHIHSNRSSRKFCNINEIISIELYTKRQSQFLALQNQIRSSQFQQLDKQGDIQNPCSKVFGKLEANMGQQAGRGLLQGSCQGQQNFKSQNASLDNRTIKIIDGDDPKYRPSNDKLQGWGESVPTLADGYQNLLGAPLQNYQQQLIDNKNYNNIYISVDNSTYNNCQYNNSNSQKDRLPYSTNSNGSSQKQMQILQILDYPNVTKQTNAVRGSQRQQDFKDAQDMNNVCTKKDKSTPDSGIQRLQQYQNGQSAKVNYNLHNEYVMESFIKQGNAEERDNIQGVYMDHNLSRKDNDRILGYMNNFNGTCQNSRTVKTVGNKLNYYQFGFTYTKGAAQMCLKPQTNV